MAGYCPLNTTQGYLVGKTSDQGLNFLFLFCFVLFLLFLLLSFPLRFRARKKPFRDTKVESLSDCCNAVFKSI